MKITQGRYLFLLEIEDLSSQGSTLGLISRNKLFVAGEPRDYLLAL